MKTIKILCYGTAACMALAMVVELVITACVMLAAR